MRKLEVRISGHFLKKLRKKLFILLREDWIRLGIDIFVPLLQRKTHAYILCHCCLMFILLELITNKH